MSEGNHVPLSPEEEQELKNLQYRDAMSKWENAEEERIAQLALLEPVVTALGGEAGHSQLCSEIQATHQPTLNAEDFMRVGRIHRSLHNDGTALIKRYNELSTPNPEPTPPEGYTPPAT